MKITIHPDIAMKPEALDLAYDWQVGRVAPDGTIWGDDPTVRWRSGMIRISAKEAAKAKHFGWEPVATTGDPFGHIYVQRT